ncbi:glycosyltransferase [Microbacterium enclense]|uniref:glycosyltransferase n=1 Tax=Microbacterium enclense TaxID=993073 RepID=UPI003F7EC645
MKLESVLGQPALFQLTADVDVPEDLSERERRLLVGALNFHALTAPGRELEAHFYDGTWELEPRTTDDATFDGLSRIFRKRLYSARMRSIVLAEERRHIRAEATADALIDLQQRHLYISLDEVLDFDPPRHLARDPLRRVLRAVRARTPLLYDEARDLELLRHRASYTRPATRRRYDEEFAPNGHHSQSEIVPVGPAVEGAVPAVLIGLHWFELGGAERWAFETVRLVREAGFLPIVISGRDSHQAWITRPELDGALVIPFSEHMARSQTPGVEQFLRNLLRSFDIRGVIVHHNQWLYDRLHWIHRSRPDIPIIDSTHVIEYRGGGFPVSSVMVDEVVTAHHVISPSLKQWMTEVQRVPAEKVVMAPLGGLTVAPRDARFRPRDAERPFTVAFVGRTARQKAPEVFVEMVNRLGADGADMRFILHGDGDMSAWIDDIIRNEGLVERIERRSSRVPVDDTLAESDLLVVTSHNEGLTLTTLEAISHGVPVISTDVGAQSDLIPPRALVSRNVHRAVAGLADAVKWLAGDEDARQQLWIDEREAEKRLLAAQTANDWFAKEVGSW